MKKNIFCSTIVFLFILFPLFFLPSCKKAEDIKASEVKPEIPLSDKAQSPPFPRLKVVHLFKDTVYLLNENFTREVGEQLIIDEGVLIKANGSITINPGAIITATGSATNPIVFTANAKPGVQPANGRSLVIRGKSFNNANGSAGIANDFSGVLNFLRIEFGSLVLDAVGSQTTVENIMVSYSRADQSGINIYGGTFNTRNLIAYACGGPTDIFITNGYTGTMQNIIACRHPFLGSTGGNPANALAGLFVQNNSNNPTLAQPYTNPVISNLTVVGPNGQSGSPGVYGDTSLRGAALVTTNSTCFQIRNSVFLGYPAGGWFLNDSNVAKNVQDSIAQFNYSFIHSNTIQRLFYLRPGIFDRNYPTFYSSIDFKNYMLGPRFRNKSFGNTADFMFTNITNFEPGPNLIPLEGSPLLSGASFTGSNYYSSNNYLNKQITYIGALGKDNWMQGWTNFTPLKTNYNFPK